MADGTDPIVALVAGQLLAGSGFLHDAFRPDLREPAARSAVAAARAIVAEVERTRPTPQPEPPPAPEAQPPQSGRCIRCGGPEAAHGRADGTGYMHPFDPGAADA
jgi:hypothetical protein